jgi:hypothetical protein
MASASSTSMPRSLDSALHFGVAKEKLNGAEVSGSSVNQGGLGSPQRMGAEQGRVETDAGDPLQQQTGILAGGEAAVPGTAAMEQKIAGTLPGRRKVLVDRLPRLLGDFEPDRTTGLLCRTVARSIA